MVWTVANHYALRSIENKGKLLIYEKILDNPDETRDILNEFLELQIDIIPSVKSQRYLGFTDTSLNPRFFKALKKYELINEFEYIVNTQNIKRAWNL